ncbi:MAG: Hsp20/alpha crystallin family protein [Planctomycetes bacterium]|nr:Hsp20/alpha crystallin family protein [Planctomycetota bacterium]
MLRTSKENDMVVWQRTTRSFDPWLQMQRLERDLGGFLRAAPLPQWPPIQAKADEKAVHLRALVPGYALEDLELTLRGEELTLRGTSKSESAHDVREFTRTLRLPFPVEAEAVKAVAKNGVLEVELPRAAAEAPRRIPVRSE